METAMTKVLILYYSSWGHIEQLAKAEAEGARASGAVATIRRVPDLVPQEAAQKLHFKWQQDAPIARVDELTECDAIIFGTPTRFGNVSAQMRQFLDQTGPLFAAHKLEGKVASVFTSSNLQHWGQESTILSFHHLLFHHGFIVVGVPPSTPGLLVMDEVSGGSPYGASTFAGADGTRLPTANELAIARAQGANVAQVAHRLFASRQPSYVMRPAADLTSAIGD